MARLAGRPWAMDALAILLAGVLGIAAERYAFDPLTPWLWIPDLLVGWILLAAGWSTARGSSLGSGVLFIAAGIAWFAGTVMPELVLVHRGPLIHLVVAYPGWRLRSRVAVATVSLGYVSVILPGLWDSATFAVGLALLVMLSISIQVRRAVGRLRRQAITALIAAGLIVVVLALGVTFVRLDGLQISGTVALLAYEAALGFATVLLWLGVRVPAQGSVTDLVVELSETRSGLLRDRLARALRDPSLEVGYWSPGDMQYVDDSGRGLRTRPEKAGAGATRARAETEIRRDGRPYVLLVHDASLLAEPVLLESVAVAARLANSNIDLQSEARANVTALTASQRKYLMVGDRERAELERRLRLGPELRLRELAAELEQITTSDPATLAQVQAARAQLDSTRSELIDLARGLHPRELTKYGLPAALRALGASAPFDLSVDVSVRDIDEDVALTAWFVCSEVMANVRKHASARQVHVSLHGTDDLLQIRVVDDGVGGADASKGSGLQGLVDRVTALGGTVGIDSPLGLGTRLDIELPNSRQPSRRPTEPLSP